MSDEDLELLESYLDGALVPPEAQRVALRASRDPSWAIELERLRAQRALRRSAWQSLEPDPDFADLAGRAAASRAFADDRSRRAARFARRASGVAAGLLIAFAGGWVARGRAAGPGTSGGVAGSAPLVTPAEFQVALTDEGGRIIAVQHFRDARQAREFAEDVGRWQSRAPREDAGDFSQISDEF